MICRSISKLAKNLSNINDYVWIDRQNGVFLNLLHFCAGNPDKQFRDKCFKYLLTFANIDINSMAKIDGIRGITAAHIASQWGHRNTLESLIELGCDLFICDSYGKNVYDYAIDSGDEKCVELVDNAIKRYHRSQSGSHLTNKSLNMSLNIAKDENFCNNSNNSFKTIEYSSVSDKTLPNIANTAINSEIAEDSERTELYFDENESVWNQMQNSSSNGSQSTLISNVSYEKTDSIKSSCTDIAETYVYKDRDNDVVLIEERYEGSNSLTKLNDTDVVSVGYATKDNDDKDVDELIRQMNGTQIYDELKAIGDSPGPVTKTTKSFYAKRLQQMKRGKLSPSKKVLPLQNYSEELNRLIQKTFPFDEAVKLEQQLINYFESHKTKQNFFNYILLDPNITQNLPFQANNQKITINSYSQIDINLFLKFIESVFYVGKGQGNRAYEHFYEAIKLSNKSDNELSDKIRRILKIWSTDKGVISLHCFPSISSDEALTRESLMIEALMLSNITNKVNGQYKCDLKLNDRKKRIIGSYLLYKAFLMLLLNGERQIKRPNF